LQKNEQQATKFWSEVDEETKERILRSWLSEKSRSKICDDMKERMEKDGLQGFESEQCFHGFFLMT